MTVVIGHAELLKNALEKTDGNLSQFTLSKLAKFAERCFNQGIMLARILEDILDLTKIETGTIATKKEIIEVNDWLEDITAIAKQLLTSKPVEAKLIIDSSTPKQIGTDSVRAKQILLNLVSNAAKFTDSGSIVIEAKGESGVDRKRTLVINIKDTGVGIEPSRHSTIFDAFEKTKVTKNVRGGQGLGLTIATQLASALGGSVRLVESELNKGATFELKLPDLGMEGLRPVSTSHTHLSQQTLKGIKIVIADDDREILEYLKELLESAGATVFCASDGAQAIELAVEKTPDVAILDLQMPVIDGFQAAQQILESVPSIAVIALSAHGLREHKEKARESGFRQFLLKPVELATVADAILSNVSA